MDDQGLKRALEVQKISTISTKVLNTHHQSIRKPQAVIVHYTAGNKDSSEAWLTKGEVSAHYLIDLQGDIISIVSEGKRAWHAGASYWRGLEDINSLSLGVEIVGWGYTGEHVPLEVKTDACQKIQGSEKDWFPYTEEQFQKIAELLQDFQKRWNIQPSFFLGHSDIAPGRKIDPGPLFPWERLYKEFNIGAWPVLEKKLRYVALPKKGEEILWTQFKLRNYGYACPVTGKFDEGTSLVLKAFQMHFRPSLIDGIIDEETCLILASLVDQYCYGDLN